MAYKCPQCGRKIGRAVGPFSGAAAAMGGAIGPILRHAFTFRFHCPHCVRDYRLREMPPGTGKAAVGGSAAALAIVVAIVALLLFWALPRIK